MKRFLLLLLALVLVVSCRHTSPFRDEAFFQALGEDGEYVLTADMNRIREGEGGLELEGNRILDRADRVTLSLVPGEGRMVPSFLLSGALEGNYGKGTTNLALGLSSSFHKEKDGDTRSYTDGNLSVASPESGIVLFTEGDYASFEERSMEKREKMVDDETAGLMASSLFALYVKSPSTLVDLGFEIPQTVLDGIGKTLLLFSGKDDAMVLSGRLEMKGSGEARAILTVLKNQMLQDAKRRGEALDYKVAATYFTQEDSVVLVNGYPLSGEALEKGIEIVSSSLGGLN